MVRTRLQVAANLNYDTLVRYLEWMKMKGFVAFTVEDGHSTIVLTQEGAAAYTKVVGVVNEVLRGC
ncbi:MAG TPA: winged helix-turn-helix domain-containing protein [Methanomassiliicoccales archaeon]|nr:winged helix-turn-helix domain-containing protein [Methanomassiliicoccales archaeon]